MPDSPLRIDVCRRDDIAVVRALADVIWRQHYPGIISEAQIDYMLARGYSREALAALVDAPGAGIALARIDGKPVGFAAWHPHDAPATVKLDKLYVLPAMHGRGVGRALVAHVEQCARAAGCTDLVLNVNKRNVGSIAMYERCGFARRESVVVDIGGGFVMDDYVMRKAL